MDHNEILEFSAVVRGYHYYKSLGFYSNTNQKLKCSHEKKTNNLFDMFAIKLCDNVRIVGHLPMDTSRPTKYLLDRGVQFSLLN